ncbi:bifunctional 2',3'-cyclic-nucleotide 2'-phosphodiesterase/3'-nucleotidase [Pseudoalteromonas peptidolytica]|uniref:2',3'-cyclic-nucleotide 2'-phosphodiesterase / 3'-nucleotidase n=1 Tax=Pseudoalteromonas peptidolytica F12-50-A1 TaxID=1315280 RepID=A0A8I0MUZ7_9GAMM|nr:bifunctional 2',3'-cyclic-nucleotide 2'-phosphodiesterase/3'-nucleotidase [Pseudoalteromonas peptidolytica]MBE0346359.1 2',3'-cyclic-nucleotide 2'-phosphodiesterase / 3'-nucleotidase [Pseudoalteromonas peptidolytica F12-50-A1]NLR14266.1 bifunctional 2',3'-cyclic-nucleotide 2'-phosphodiesterase/3'-nucleotidase [Pseudoalteromonas peptidolytica]GEK11655.1 2',3'-cyclic-nucleotide 2'-phosphodiesterase [Pseudoalteromonas peptidolytica]
MNTTRLPIALLLGVASIITGCSDSDNDVEINIPKVADLPKEGTLVSLRLLETTDLHANMLNYNYFSDKQDDKVGLVKTAALIHHARSEVKNAMLVDNGDLIQGSPLGDYIAKIKDLKEGDVHPVYKAMNTLTYDVANIGNHEFNFGLEFLEEAINDANFPYISANVFKVDGDEDESNDVPFFTPYIVKEKRFLDELGKEQVINVGFIGFVPPQIMQWDKANLEGKVIAKDIIKMAEYYIPKMKAEGADIIVAIPHSGLDVSADKPMAENASYALSKVEGIDAIMFGHAHANFPGAGYGDLQAYGIDNEKGTINGVAAVMPGFWGNHLGIIDLDVRFNSGEWVVVDSQSMLRPIYETDDNRNTVSLVESDATIEAAIRHEHNETRTWVNEPFAKITNTVNSYFALVNDDPSIQIVTDSQAWYTAKIVQGTELEGLPILSAGAPFRAGRGGPDDFTAIPAGDIAYRNVADMYIYPNVLKVLKLSGAEVREWLEMSAGQFNQITANTEGVQALINPDFPSYNYDVLDGVTYQIDVTEPARYAANGDKVSNGNRIKALKYQGELVTDEQIFLVATNNYRTSGGGNFPNVSADKIVVDSPNENRQVVADYITYVSEKNGAKGLDPSADMNWSFSPVVGAHIEFFSSASTDAELYSQQFIHILPTGKTNENGFALYQLDLTQPL